MEQTSLQMYLLAPYDEAALLEINLVGKRLTEIARAYKDEIVLTVKTQNRTDLIVEIFDIISVTLLAEPAEIIEILPYL